MLRTPSTLLLLLIASLLALGIAKVHIKVQTLAIGYELGALKKREARALKSASELTMELSVVTTRNKLTELANREGGTP